MSSERKKITLYLHPESPADKQALDVIEKIPRSARGEFYRHALIAGAALQDLDARLPSLLSALFTTNIKPEQLVSLITQTTDWKPTQASIIDVVNAITGKNIILENNEQVKNDDAYEVVRQKLNKIL
ncbi:plasmid partitioning/stability family protein [Providencia rettgeri]|uniref:plasmid partitioning/stability family protein n=1 Tax=Providencia rettgeri TaxID=587 RepID=UPI0019D46838|nr:plasmid partitioning/stability family protein [Providencia rettgeri]EMB3084087.1 plasmid partitioning/stability family protein [Providencia rettgeri]MBN7843624.1 plasmid partitioning/stability family protein [Providencia rettgeri]MBN7855312.1 plasmid partitioning/stability family protein [Providencia rettgeri]MBN7863274.1 plasmid partitioning/stability family protein [Providencia rettgeri]MBN7872546.1 plasmid partitioning/stability family protein [Providencia rettgeri]